MLNFWNKAGGERNDDIGAERMSSLSGYLWKMKRGQKILVPQWNKRWFSIEGRFFRWYETASSEKPSGTMDLNTLDMVKEVESGTEGAFTFMLNNPERKLLLRATSQAEVEKWIRALNSQADLARGGMGHSIVNKSTVTGNCVFGKGRKEMQKSGKRQTLEDELDRTLLELQALEKALETSDYGLGATQAQAPPSSATIHVHGTPSSLTSGLSGSPTGKSSPQGDSRFNPGSGSYDLDAKAQQPSSSTSSTLKSAPIQAHAPRTKTTNFSRVTRFASDAEWSEESWGSVEEISAELRNNIRQQNDRRKQSASSQPQRQQVMLGANPNPKPRMQAPNDPYPGDYHGSRTSSNIRAMGKEDTLAESSSFDSHDMDAISRRGKIRGYSGFDGDTQGNNVQDFDGNYSSGHDSRSSMGGRSYNGRRDHGRRQGGADNLHEYDREASRINVNGMPDSSQGRRMGGGVLSNGYDGHNLSGKTVRGAGFSSHAEENWGNGSRGGGMSKDERRNSWDDVSEAEAGDTFSSPRKKGFNRGGSGLSAGSGWSRDMHSAYSDSSGGSPNGGKGERDRWSRSNAAADPRKSTGKGHRGGKMNGRGEYAHESELESSGDNYVNNSNINSVSRYDSGGGRKAVGAADSRGRGLDLSAQGVMETVGERGDPAGQRKIRDSDNGSDSRGISEAGERNNFRSYDGHEDKVRVRTATKNSSRGRYNDGEW